MNVHNNTHIDMCVSLCEYLHMATNLNIAPELLEKAVEVGHHRTKRAAVETALKEYINRHKQLDVLELFGRIDYHESYDYKKARKVPCE